MNLARLDAQALLAAMRRHDDAVVRLCGGDGSPRLGWINPPRWEAVRDSLAAIDAAWPGTPAELVLLGTGGWAFAAQALAETAQALAETAQALAETAVNPPASRVRVLDSLDPQASRPASRVRVLDSLDPQAIRATGEAAHYLAVSASGSTLETRRLAEAVRGPTVWLCDTADPPDVFALSPTGARDQVAMLGAPLSTGFLYPAFVLDPAGFEALYRGFVERHQEIALAAVERAVAIPVGGDVHIDLSAGGALRRWMLQLGRQVLCGKSATFRPEVTVAEAPAPRTMPELFDILYGATIFAGALALRAGLNVAEHANVGAYKRLLAESPIRMVDDLSAAAAGLRPELRRLHVVYYGGSPPAVLSGRPTETHEGSAWNHHSFHAVYADPSTAVLLVIGERDTAATLQRIAVATHRALPDRSLLVQLRPAKGGST